MPEGCPIKHHIEALLGSIQIRMTPTDLEGALTRRLPHLKRTALRKAIRAMVAEGALMYTNHYSTTHLEVNFKRPVRVSDRVTLCPASCRCQASEYRNSLIIKLNDGTAFGMGDHPTTRLCIQGLDHVITRCLRADQLAGMTALDIGTGSAVLAMVAVGLGMGGAVGNEIDPVACHEAKANLELNGMTDRITITHTPLAQDEKRGHAMIMANLRPPSLKDLFPVMEKISNKQAIWVLSGYRAEEERGVEALLPTKTAKVLWRSQACGWAAMAVKLQPHH